MPRGREDEKSGKDSQPALLPRTLKSPLLTRIGINTGSMVVGNMGTPQKMNYTMMGNAVNLASRLEGVNKQYGTWMMMSEATHDAGGKDFFMRKLDRVRVVGINEPVRLLRADRGKGRRGQDRRAGSGGLSGRAAGFRGEKLEARCSHVQASPYYPPHGRASRSTSNDARLS